MELLDIGYVMKRNEQKPDRSTHAGERNLQGQNVKTLFVQFQRKNPIIIWTVLTPYRQLNRICKTLFSWLTFSKLTPMKWLAEP